MLAAGEPEPLEQGMPVGERLLARYLLRAYRPQDDVLDDRLVREEVVRLEDQTKLSANAHRVGSRIGDRTPSR